jgi:hypothetical protein
MTREFVLGEIPKLVHCLLQCVVIGHKRSYEVIDTPSGRGGGVGVHAAISTRILNIKEHSLCCLELPETAFRQDSVLLSSMLYGMVLDSTPIGIIEGTPLPLFPP